MPANDFGVKLPEFPIAAGQYDQYVQQIGTPGALDDVPLGQLYQMQAEMKQFEEAQLAMRERLAQQGLNEEQIARVEAAQREGGIDPNEQSDRNLIRQEPQRDLTGVVEGAAQAVEGVADLAMDISVELSLNDPADRQAWKEQVTEARTVRREAQMQQLGQLPGPVGEVVGQIVPWMVAGPGAASRFFRFLGRSGMLGAAATASQFQPSDKALVDRQRDAIYGAAWGTAFAIPFSVPALMRRGAARSLVKSFNEADPQQRELVEAMTQEMTGNKNFKFSAAQLTGTRFYQNLELATADTATKAQQNLNLETLWNNVLRLSGLQGGTGKSAGQIAASIRETLKRAKDELYQQAQSSWAAKSKQIVDEFGDEAIIDGRDYLRKIDELISEQQDRLQSTGAKPSDNLIRYREEVDSLVNPATVTTRVVKKKGGGEETQVFILDRRSGHELRVLGDTSSNEGLQRVVADGRARAQAMNEAAGGPTADETLRILNGLNRLIGGKTVIFDDAGPGANRTIGRALMGNFTSAMDANPSNPEAVAAIKALREGYRMDMAVVGALNRSVFNKAFGGKELPNKIGDKLDAMLRGEREDLVQLREFLEEYEPDLLYDLRATHLERIWKSSTKSNKPDVDTAVDLNKLSKNLSDNFERQGLAGAGLHNPGTQAEMILTADALRILANKQYKGVIPGGIRPEEWSINLISRSPEFFGRFVTRLFASGQTLEKALLDPSWRKALRTVAKEDLDSKTGRAALLYLATWWKEKEEVRMYEEQQKAQMQQAQQQAQQNLLQGGPQ